MNQTTELLPLHQHLFPGAVLSDAATSRPALAPVGGVWAARHWTRTFQRWLTSKAPNTQRAYRRAWDDLLSFSGKHPAHIGSADLQEGNPPC